MALNLADQATWDQFPSTDPPSIPLRNTADKAGCVFCGEEWALDGTVERAIQVMSLGVGHLESQHGWGPPR